MNTTKNSSKNGSKVAQIQAMREATSTSDAVYEATGAATEDAPKKKYVRKSSAAHITATMLAKTNARMQRIVKRLGAWGGVTQAAQEAANDLEKATTLIASAVTTLQELPADWRPRGRVAREVTGLEPGTRVEIIEKHLAAYKDILDDADFSGLVVERVKGTNVVVSSPSGRMILRRGHLAPIVDADA